MIHGCQRQLDPARQCAIPAVCAVAIAIYPPKALLDFYKTDKPLSRLIFTLFLCEEHMVECETDGAFVLMPRQKIEAIAKLMSARAGTAVDVEATKIVRVALDDSELKVLLRQSREKKELHRG